MTKSDKRICRDCRYSTSWITRTTCDLKDVYETDLVTGIRILSRAFSCELERKHGRIRARLLGTCGKEGRFWEKKNG